MAIADRPITAALPMSTNIGVSWSVSSGSPSIAGSAFILVPKPDIPPGEGDPFTTFGAVIP
jgi:hypothetical protein